MDDGDALPSYLQMRPYSGEWNGAWQDARPAGGKAFRPTPPSERRNVERVLFASAQTEATAESMLDDAWREQAAVQDRSSGSKGQVRHVQNEMYQGMSLKKFGYGGLTKDATQFAEQVGGSASASMPQRRKEQKEGRSLDLQDLAFSRPRKIVDGQIKSNYTPVSLPYFRVADADAEASESARPTIQNVDETNGNAARQLFFSEDGSLLEDQLFLMQLPSVLPEMLDPFDEVQRGQEDSDTTGGGATMTRLPDGHWGKLRIHKSGKVRMELGGVDFCVDEGCTTFFQQDLACVCPLANEVFHLGKVHKRMVLTPDVDALLAGLSETPPCEASPNEKPSGSAADVAPSLPSATPNAPARRVRSSPRARAQGGGAAAATSSASSAGERTMPSAGMPTSLAPRGGRT